MFSLSLNICRNVCRILRITWSWVFGGWSNIVRIWLAVWLPWAWFAAKLALWVLIRIAKLSLRKRYSDNFSCVEAFQWQPLVLRRPEIKEIVGPKRNDLSEATIFVDCAFERGLLKPPCPLTCDRTRVNVFPVSELFEAPGASRPPHTEIYLSMHWHRWWLQPNTIGWTILIHSPPVWVVDASPQFYVKQV